MQQQDSFDTPSAAPPAHTLSIRFTGSGSEYFRIWIVNLLLTVVTLGIYLPWAKVRRLKYFHGNTLVGDAPLGFHGDPRKMLRGYLLVSLMFVLYSVAGQFSPVAGLVALLAVVLLAPALVRAGLQFRLANTSWRGLRLHFTGGLREAYVLLIPVLAMVGIGVGIGLFAGLQPPGSQRWMLGLVPVILLLQAWAGVWMLWRLKRYQHSHYALASLQTRFTARQAQFAGLFLRTAGWGLLWIVLCGAVSVGLLFLLRTQVGQGKNSLFALLPLLLVALTFVAVKPYFTARLQDLVWNHTRSDVLQFHSALSARRMLALTAKNWLLIILTLGLYWPFAAIAMARLRLQAMSLETRDDPDTLVDSLRPAHQDAAGDAAGDLFGLDVGL